MVLTIVSIKLMVTRSSWMVLNQTNVVTLRKKNSRELSQV